MTSFKPVAGVEVKPWDELAKDQARAKAAELIKAKGWKAGDSFSVTAMLALMVEFAEQAHTVTDRCGYPDCGCDFDARCMDALLPKATAPVVSEPVGRDVAFEKALYLAVAVQAFVGRDEGTDRMPRTIEGLVKVARETDAVIRSAITSPQPQQKAVTDEMRARIIDALEMSIPHTFEFDAESGGYYDTELSRELHELSAAMKEA